MPQYKISGKGADRYVVEATNETVALSSVQAVYTGANPDIVDYNADFTQYNKSLPYTFVAQANKGGKDYYISDNTQAGAIAKFNTAFAPLTLASIKLKRPQIKLDLIGGIATFIKPYLVNVHQNGKDLDFTKDTQDDDITLAKYYNYNGFRCDYNAVFNGNDFSASDATTKDTFWTFVGKVAAQNMFFLPVISSSHAMRNPAVANTSSSTYNANSDYVKSLGSRGVTMAEYTGIMNQEEQHGIYFATKLLASGVKSPWIEWGSENDVMQQTTKLNNGTGIRPLADFQTDTDGTPYWTNKYLSSDPTKIEWPAKNFGMLVYGFWGFMKGVLSVIPNMKFMYNYSFTHYGQTYAISRDIKKLAPKYISDAFDTAGTHDYTDHEAYLDISNTFLRKKSTDNPANYYNDEIWPNGVPMAHYAVIRNKFFLNKPETSIRRAFISEGGFTTPGATPDGGGTPVLFYQNYWIPYQNDPNCEGTAWFLLRNATKTRAGTQNTNELHYGIEDVPGLAAFLHSYIPPNTQ